ncbi:cell wall / vacuolar inhibitor of fructosidase 1-like [Durio zibethinus]|uniref:Cell wall / vacuolar inhibitor of fructosidase 1-like n=1 Tax=Durio zibethinus TaxID=66656 RepID=A0A6P5YNX3_DURZI|nr:cell wall / vacuolar inhibitor of fructosidase 1-like [Durio zibethinus]
MNKLMRQILTALLLILILEFLATTSVSVTKKGVDLIQETCKHTGFFNLCVSSLRSDPRSSNADLEGLARISVEILQDKAKDTLTYVGNLFKHVSDPVLYRSYGSCIEYYRASVERQLPEAIDALASKNYVTSKNDAAAAATNVDSCEQQFANKSPFNDRDKVVHDLALVASSIIGLLG